MVICMLNFWSRSFTIMFVLKSIDTTYQPLRQQSVMLLLCLVIITITVLMLIGKELNVLQTCN